MRFFVPCFCLHWCYCYFVKIANDTQFFKQGLDISDEIIRIQVSADLLVDGTARILDLSNSPWDEEDKTFVFMSYGTLFFKKANGSVSFSLTFVPEKNNGWKVNNHEVIIPNGVELVLNDENVQFKEDFDPTEYQGDVSDTLQEYYFH